MNFALVRHICGQAIRFEAAFMGLSLVVSLLYGEYDLALIFLKIIGAMVALSFCLAWKKPANRSFHAKEGLTAVSVSWIAISLFGALPFFFSGACPSFTDSLFESISGFTTTGASILKDVEVLDRGLLFWRSFTHWIGGMGVLVFIMALLPMTGADPLYLMRAESPGPTVEKLVPKTRNMAVILYSIYLGLTVLEIVLLLCGGMPLFDSVVHTFGTAGTGGFSIKNASIAAYNSLYAEIVIAVFMVLFGVNFGVYFLLIAGKFRALLTNEEVRVYFAVILASILAIAFNITGSVYNAFGDSLRYSSFQVASIITTTGYATANFDTWPTLSKLVLVFLMFIGACAGSTGGGIKVSRFIILYKSFKREALKLLHPQAVTVVKLDRAPISEEVIRGTGIFFMVYIALTAISILAVSLDGFDLVTTTTAVAACINNVGPGLGAVSAIGNYSGFSPFSIIVLSLDMLIGRLEVFPMLLLLSPYMWSKRLR